jgi:hypothetical protein
MSDWTSDIESVLENIRVNSIMLSIEHKKKYFYLNEILRYFRLPVIIISGVNSIVSVGMQPYLSQNIISMITCLLALLCSIIGSIELYLTIQKSMENELLASKDYYILSIDIYKCLNLNKEHRPIPAKEYLDKKYNDYVKLFENSNLIAKKISDKLNPLPIEIQSIISTNNLNSISNNTNKSDEELGLELSENKNI